jgi:teichuronic acid biosynthesis glycosyltransferase TuaC
MNICIVSIDYPSKKRPVFTFVLPLVEELVNSGINCTVIAPFSITNSLIHRHVYEKKYELATTNEGNKYEIYRPNYVSFSNLKIFGFSLSTYFHRKAIERTLEKIKRPDVIYGHFWNSAVGSYKYAVKYDLPLFVAAGEEFVPKLELSSKKVKGFYKFIKGVICVSSVRKNEIVEKGLVDSNSCGVFVNGVDLTVFNRLNKVDCRKHLGFLEKDFIVCYVGEFSDRKGSMRLSKSIDLLNDQKIKSVFIGSGKSVPDCNGILFKGRVPHDDVNLYLNACDIFVLPTLNEGCSNAIVEALACGLPVISSNRPFNADILNSKNSILVDPTNLGEIAAAIKKLKDNKIIKEELSKGALMSAKKLSIKNRANNILSFIKSSN